MESRRVGHDWAPSLSLFTFMHWRRKWQPTPVFLPGESQGRGSLVGCRLWGHDWSDLAAAAAGYIQDLYEIPETFWGLWGALVCGASRVSLATRMSLPEQRLYLLLLFCVIFIILSSLCAKQFSMEWFILIIKRRQYSFGGWRFCLSYKI